MNRDRLTDAMARIDPQDVGRYEEIMRRLTRKHGFFTLEIPFPVLAVLLAHVRLALRHPGNVGDAAKLMHDFLDQTIETLERSEPGISEFLRKDVAVCPDCHHPIAQCECEET